MAGPSLVLDPRRVAAARPRRTLLAIAAGSTALATVVYLFAVRTTWGQRLDSAAVKGRHVLSRHDVRLAARVHTTIDVASVALLGAAIVIVALLRSRPRLALGAGTVIGGSLATTEALKRLLGRPDFGIVDAMKNTPSYPSGHTTIAMALAIGAVFVSPRHWRAVVAALGALFASAVGCSVVATASHRPSDPIGAAFVVTAWAAAVAAVLLRSPTDRSPGRPAWLGVSRGMALGGVALLVMSFVSVTIIVIAVHYNLLDTIAFGRAFIAAGAAIVGTVLICTAGLLMALHDVDLGRPTRLNASERTSDEEATVS